MLEHETQDPGRSRYANHGYGKERQQEASMFARLSQILVADSASQPNDQPSFNGWGLKWLGCAP